ncbi:MAG: type II CAAX endopeptidase family protein, partial [Clostridia bacterium]|nr:type II CAAX endopeptidase family protein [Clostridia bacterium]
MIKTESGHLPNGRVIYTALVLGMCYILFAAALLYDGGDNLIYEFLQKGFTAFPVLAAVATRFITRDKSPWKISLKVWKNGRMWLFCALAPGILVAIGAVAYFMAFPGEYSGNFNYGELIALTGARSGGMMQISNPALFWTVTILVSAAFIPIQLLELGEEIGWREYLLPRQIERYGARKAVLLNGFLWGMAHMPLIYFGFNYSLDNPAAPWSNMAMMMLVCVVMGIILSYVMIKSGNVLYPAIIHGVFNVIGEV